MLKAFGIHDFKSHGIISTFLVTLGGKIVSIEVEVVNAPLDYDISLGISWLYAMMKVVSLVFRVLHFPNQGEVVSIDHLEYCMPDF